MTMEALLKKQDRYSGYIIRSFDNLKRLDRENVTLGVVEAKIATLEKQWNTFFLGHEELEGTATVEDQKKNYFMNDVYGLTEDGYFKNKGKFLDLVRKFEKEEAVLPNPQPQPRTQQLPKIALPKFSGEFSEWPSFRDLFSSMVSNNTSLTAIEKLHYLKMSLEKEPLALLASLQLTAENLDTAWRTLTDRYENVRLLTTAQILNILTLQPMKSESSAELKSLYNGTTNAVSALRALGRPVDGYGDLLVYLTVQKLDKQSRREWESSMGAKKDPPTFKELQTFIEARICAIQALEPTTSATALAWKTSSSSSIHPKTDCRAATKVKSHQASGTPNRSKKCSFCQQDHFIVYCDRFRSKSLQEKKAFVLVNKLCFNCLGQHFVRECNSSKACQKCKAKHHTMIHGSGANASGARSNIVTGTTGGNGASTTAEEPAAPSVPGLVTHQARCHASGSATQVLLATAVVHVFTAGGTSIPVRVLLDQGSEASFVSESLAQRLRIPRTPSSVAISGIGAQSSIYSRGRVKLRISSRVDSGFELTVDALVLPRLTTYVPPQFVEFISWPHLEGLVLADPDFTSDLRIDLLLGSDVYSQLLLPGVRNGPLEAPVAQNTRLGWILSGRVVAGSETSTACFSHQTSLDHSLSSALQRFWEQEEIVASPSLTEEERECEEHFVSTHSRNSEGRYIVRLPLKKPLVSLGDSRSAAARMLARMEQRFSRDAAFAEKYTAFITEYEVLQHMELVPPALEESKSTYYLPHHGVVRESSETTKLRVVFNGSQKTSLGVTLNDCLHVGPPLLPDLVNVMLRWRRYAIVFSADMEKMFRQIILHPDDRDFQRILWRKPPRLTPDTYRLCTVTYGLACAPYLALRVIRQLGLDGRESYPLGSEALLTDVYVDDVLSGADDVASALSKQSEIIELLKAGGFSLRKWTSNSPHLLAHLSPSFLASGTTLEIPSEAAFHMLGLSWRADSDCFTFRLKTAQCELPLTKRRVLSKIAELFDPFGWLAPVIIKAKIFLQSLWLLKLDWDDPLPIAESNEWSAFYAHLPRISNVRIPRWLRLQSTPQHITLHGFADASERAYAAVVYLCVAKGRTHKSTKAYIVVFVCFAVKAVHLETVSDYTTEAFLAAYKRFISRRGLCKTISSDCGTNFVGADSELRSLFTAASTEFNMIAAVLANDGVEWKFNPPSAPHFGGLWEAAVKSVKHHLRRVIGETTLTFEEMATLLAQIECCLNSRPLQALTDDPEDLDVLTPGHFLIGAPLSAVPEPTLSQLPASRLSRWQLIQQMRDSFWSRWASEYLHQLQGRPKWRKPHVSFQIGDLVLVVNELYAPTKWPLARVTATHAGEDGHVRVATVKTATSILKRPIIKLCLLSKKDDLEATST